jgi:type III restriction enzyme
MELKNYQQRAIRETRTFLEFLEAEQAKGNKHASADAWDEVSKQRALYPHYRPHKSGLGKDVPTSCVKVPTGGGKTLLATHFLGLIHQTILKSRNGAGPLFGSFPATKSIKIH